MWAIALMDCDFELKYTPGEQIPHATASKRTYLDTDNSNNDWVCFAIFSTYLIQNNLVIQAEFKTEPGTNRLLQDIKKRIKSGNWEHRSEAEQWFKQQKRCTDYTKVTHLLRCCSILSAQTTTLGSGKRARETPWKNNPYEATIKMIAWRPGITQDLQHIASKINKFVKRKGLACEKQFLCG